MNNAIQNLDVPVSALSTSYDLLTSKVLIDLQNRGFSHFFKVTDQCICCEDYTITFEEFDILEVHSTESTLLEKNCVV